VLEHKLDILCITETWISVNDNFATRNVTPIGYNIISNSRNGKRGGGVAVILKDHLAYKKLVTVVCDTFEVLLLRVTSCTKSFVIATIYRSPGPLANFLTELNNFIANLVSNSDDFVLAGDFNIHMDMTTDDSARKLSVV